MRITLNSFGLVTFTAALGCTSTPMMVVPPEPCGGDAPLTLSVVEGGRVEVARTGELLLAGLRVEGDLEASIESSRIVLRAPYGEGARTARFVCATGTATASVDVQPLRWSSVAEWTANEAEGVPGGREYFAWWLSPEASEQAIYMYGGFAFAPRQFTPRTDLYRFDLRTSVWSQVTQTGPLPAPGGRVAAGADGAIHYFGGGLPTPDGSLDTQPAFLRWSATGFEALSTEGAPGSYTGSLVYDAPRDRWLSLCGVDTIALGLHCRVHAYTEADGWSEVEIAGDAPMGRYGFHYAFDEETDRVILFGGQVGQSNAAIGADTWALELAPESGEPTWVQLFEEVDGISKRRNGAYALDPIGHRLFVWGGTPDGTNAVQGLDVLSLDRGTETWTHLETPEGGPRARGSAQGLYDPTTQQIFWGFGNSIGRVYTDLWSLALTPASGM